MAQILIIDDDPQVLDTLSDVVSSLGHAPQVAADGRSGLERFFQGRFDLVLTDLAMPGVDGLEVLRRVKAVQPHTGVIVVTGHSRVELLANAVNSGVDAYITKPFKLGEIDQQLRRVLLKQESEAERSVSPPTGTRRAGLVWGLLLLLLSGLVYLLLF